MCKQSSEDSYVINTESRTAIEDIMQRIYQENPSYWPDGLSVVGHDDLYMIRQATTNEPVGFTGWQFRNEDGKRVGYYSIGILPEYRQNGFAKEAVAKLMQVKAAEVDIVKAYVAPHNAPSLALAESLGVPVIKSASWMSKVKALPAAHKGAIIGGVGNTALWDWAANEHNPWEGEYWKGFDKHRLSMGAINALLGVAGGGMMGKGLANAGGENAASMIGGGAATIGLSPVKDWVAQSLPAASKLPGMVENISNSTGMSKGERLALMGIGGAGLAGLGIGGYKALGALRDLVNTEKERGGGRMRVTLPTRNPNDRETVIDVPFHEVGVSNNARSKMQRDLRRRVNAEVKERTIKRRKNPASKDNEEDEGENEQKAASLLPNPSASMASVKLLLHYVYGK